MTPTLRLEFRTELVAAPARVFSALTEGPELPHWFCDRAESAPIPGGRITLAWDGPAAGDPAFEGHWVVLRKPGSCAYEGGHAGYPDGYAGRVGFELAPRAGGTVLITRHLLPARPDYEPIAERYRAAWPRALARLAAYLERSPAARPA